MVFGTFDILHAGHRNFFAQARKMGDYLIVVVARDETVAQLKKIPARNNEALRRQALIAEGAADRVLLGSQGPDKYRMIKKYCPDIIGLGYDQCSFDSGLREKLEEWGMETEIIRLKPYHPERYKSSKLKPEVEK